MTVQYWQHKFGDWACPPCVRHSHAKAEHTRDHLYPLLDDSLAFPTITRGRSTGRWFITTSCHCGLPLRDRSFRTQGYARMAWRGTCQRMVAAALNEMAGEVSK